MEKKPIYFKTDKTYIFGITNGSKEGKLTPPATIREQDLGIEDLIDFFTFIKQTSDLSVTIEAMAGFELGGNLRAALGLINARVSLTGLMQITYEGKFYDNNELDILEDSDALKALQTEIKKLFTSESPNKRYGIKSTFNLLK